MTGTYTEGKEFKMLQHTNKPLPKGEYDNCNFSQCDFSNCHLSGYIFLECTFRDCDFSNIHLGNTAFREVSFKDCKLLGTRFDECNDFLLKMDFEGCQLQLSSFFGLPLKNCRFENCQLNEVDFTDADLSSAVLRKCDLNQTIFENTRLHKADLRQSYGFSIDPEVNPIHEARFSKDSLEGLLHKHNLRIE